MADSRCAVLSKYSKPAPVVRAASRMEPVMRDAMSLAASSSMATQEGAIAPNAQFPPLARTWAIHGKRRLNAGEVRRLAERAAAGDHEQKGGWRWSVRRQPDTRA